MTAAILSLCTERQLTSLSDITHRQPGQPRTSDLGQGNYLAGKVDSMARQVEGWEEGPEGPEDGGSKAPGRGSRW